MMPNPVRAIPEGYHSISPSLTCKNAALAIDFYKSVFGATEVMRMPGPEGKIMHAELRIGNSVIFINDEFPGMAEAPASGIMPSIYLFLYTEDVDSVYNRAVSMGSKVAMPLDNMFWGDRYGKVVDPFGHQWGLAQHVEDVAPEEMKRRQEEMAAKMAKAAGQS
jgi:PhnB protein